MYSDDNVGVGDDPSSILVHDQMTLSILIHNRMTLSILLPLVGRLIMTDMNLIINNKYLFMIKLGLNDV